MESMKCVRYMAKSVLCAAWTMVSLFLAVGCSDFLVEESVKGQDGDYPPTTSTFASEIAPSVGNMVNATPTLSKGRLSTRSLINQESTVSIRANFLRVDEGVANNPTNPVEHHRGLYTFDGGDSRYEGSVNWEKAHLMEATIMSASGDDDGGLRSVVLEPTQSYNMRVVSTQDENNEQVLDTVDIYHTRMVGWYPMNCTVPRTSQGTAANVLFDENYDHVSFPTTIDTDGDGVSENVVAIKFSGLNGKTDVMVSNMREGQHWHKNNGTHRSDFMPDDVDKVGPSIYKEPFGRFSQEEIAGVQEHIEYDNVFTYNHYLSAVRIFAYADQSPQNLIMWGTLEKVMIADQPTSVKVWLPDREGVWGEAFDWADYQTFEACYEPIFGEGDTSSQMPETATYPITLINADKVHQMYLGYALVQPDRDVTVQLHTSSGVYSVTIPTQYLYTEGGNERTADVFKAGYIYNIHLNLKTTGTIAAILENENDEYYYDLTRLHTYDDGYDDDDDVSLYKHANCYICSPNHTFVTDEDGNQVLDEGGNPRHYDGYCFSATVAGNGDGGILSYGSLEMYPTSSQLKPLSARLLWESELGLITQVELLFGYVRFKIPDKTKEGNAVIAVYGEDGELLWSWHIWVTDPPQEQIFVGEGGNEIVLLDRNLGATSDRWITGDPSSALATYGLYYQWGRKDPSMGPLTYDYLPITLITAPYWDYSSMERRAAEVVQLARPTLEDGVKNPMFLILPSEQTETYTYNWTHTSYDFLWGYIPDDGTITKTIYDPCPFGYRVPLSEMGTIFAEDEHSDFTTPNTNEYGQKFTNNGTTFYFPYAGYKGVDVGLNSLVMAWNYVGEKGDYMSASVSKDTNNKYNHRSRLYISRSNNWTETNVGSYYAYRTNDFTNRRTAGSVRCVKNVEVGLLNLSIATDKPSVVTNDNVVITMKGNSSESRIVTAILEVKNLHTGATKILYQTPNGVPESSTSQWSRQEVFTTGDEGGEFYSPLGYRFSLTCINNLGVSSTVTTSVEYHALTIDLESKWEEAEQNETSMVNTNILRNVHILASEQPSKVEVLYNDGTTDRTVDITGTGFNSLLPSENHAVNMEYVANLKFSTIGTHNVTVRVTCGLPDAHIITKQTTVTIAEPLEVTLSPSSRYLWASDDELNPYVPVSVQYFSRTTNADTRPERPDDTPKIVSQTLRYTDNVSEPQTVEIPLDEERADLSVSEGSAVVMLDSNGTLNNTITYTAVGGSGAISSVSASVGLLHLMSDEFPSVVTLGNEHFLHFHMHGGGEPTSVTLDGEPMELEIDHSSATVYIHDGTWHLERTFNSLGEHTLDLVVTLQDENGHDIVLPTKTFTVMVYNSPVVALEIAPRHIWRNRLGAENVVARWEVSTPNGAASEVVTTIDGNQVASLSIVGNMAPDAERSGDIAAELQGNTDGRAEVVVTITDEVGASLSKESYVAIMDVAFAANWSDDTFSNTYFERTLTVNGGEEPVAVSVGGVEFSKSATDNTTDYYSTTSWTGSFIFDEGVYDNLPVVLTFADGSTLTHNYAPTLNVVKPIDPITVNIATTDEIFHGAKSAGSISASASSPNGNLVEVRISDSAGNIIFEGNPNNGSWSNATLTGSLMANVRGVDEVLTIYARDEFGVEATSSATVDIYYLVRQTNNTFVANGMYLMENRQYEGSYTYDSGNYVGATTTLSSNALFTFSSSTTSQKIKNTNSGHYASGNSPSCTTTSSNNATTYTVQEYSGDYFRIYSGSRYWRMTGATSMGTQNRPSDEGATNLQWMIYRALVD